MPARLKYEDVKRALEEAGCILVSKDYKNSKEHLGYVCSCHAGEEDPPVYEMTYREFKRGTRCPDCRNERVKATTLS